MTYDPEAKAASLLFPPTSEALPGQGISSPVAQTVRTLPPGPTGSYQKAVVEFLKNSSGATGRMGKIRLLFFADISQKKDVFH